MSKLNWGFLLIVLLSACQSGKSHNSESSILKVPSVENKVNPKLFIGRWGDIKDTTSLFSVDKNEIYYYDALESYKYKLIKDTLIVFYAEYNDTSLIKLKNKDTLLTFGLGKFKDINDTLRRFYNK